MPSGTINYPFIGGDNRIVNVVRDGNRMATVSTGCTGRLGIAKLSALSTTLHRANVHATLPSARRRTVAVVALGGDRISHSVCSGCTSRFVTGFPTSTFNCGRGTAVLMSGGRFTRTTGYVRRKVGGSSTGSRTRSGCSSIVCRGLVCGNSSTCAT